VTEKTTIELGEEIPKLRIYVPGKIPSGRDIQNLCAIFEVSLVWAAISFTAMSDDRKVFNGYVRSFISYLEDKNRNLLLSSAANLKDRIDDLRQTLDVAKLLQSDTKYLTSYPHYGIRKAPDSPEEALKNLTNLVNSPKKWIRTFNRDRGFGEGNFLFTDFNDWVSEYIGNNVLDTEVVSTTNSIEFIFNIITFASIFGLQSSPILKDVITYSITVVQEWLGKSKAKPILGHPPKLSPTLLRTISKYDDVEIVVNNTEIKISLKR